MDERRVLTCAHVARPKGRPERPDLWVAFPGKTALCTRPRVQI
ncbi:hypothetical protein [Sphaerisporangium flaviroseum]